MIYLIFILIKIKMAAKIELNGVELDAECFTANEVIIIDKIGQENYSMVNQVSYKGSNKYTLKVVELPIDFGNDFDEEVRIMSLMSEHKIGIPFIKAWKYTGQTIICGESKPIELGFILTEKWFTFEADNKKVPVGVLAMLLDKINLLHELRYVHGNPRITNVVYKNDKQGQLIDVRLIDFGLSFNLDDHNLNIDDLQDRLRCVNSYRKKTNLLTAQTKAEHLDALFLYDLVAWL